MGDPPAMPMNLSRVFITRPVATSVLMLALVAFGWLAYLRLPVNDLPNVDFPTVSVSASLPGASPQTMASTVATPLERQFLTIPGISEMSSSSNEGSTRITIQFDLSRDIDAAAQDVQTAIAQASRRLPEGMGLPTLRKVNPADAAILYLALTAKTMPLSDLDRYADTHVTQRLSTVPGVAQVLVFGSQKYAVRIYLDPYKLAARGLSLERVATGIQRGNSNLPSGTLQGGPRNYTVEAEGGLARAAQFEDLIVAFAGGAPVRLRALGRAEDSVENNEAATWYNDTRAIVLAVQRQPGSNTVQVVDEIRALLPEIGRGLPAGVELHVLNDRSSFIRDSIHEVNFTLALAIALVVGVILMFLRNVSATLITALVLPTSLAATFGVMYLLGFSLNNLTLLGLTLAVGFVVDDAIVVLENIMRHLEMGKSRLQAALDGSREIAFTVVSMTVSLVAVFIPILFMGGLLGRLFNEFAVTIAVAILMSALVALTLPPMLAAHVLRVPTRHGRVFAAFERAFDRAQGAYERGLRAAMRRRGAMLLLSVAVLAATAWLTTLVPKGFIPRQDTGTLMGSTRAAEGIAFEDLVRKQRQVAEIIRQDSAVDALMSTAGQAGGGVAGANVGRVIVRLKPAAERDDSDTVTQRLRRKVQAVGGMQLVLQAPSAINLGPGGRGEQQYVLTGNDTSALYEVAEAVEARLKEIPVLQDVNSDLELNNPEIRVEILRDRAAALGVDPQSVEQALYDAYGSRRVSTILGGTDQYSVILQLEPEHQRDLRSLSALYVPAGSGALVPLENVARLSAGAGPLSVQHYGPLPAVTVGFNVAPGASIGEAVQAIQTATRGLLPPDIGATFAGPTQTFQESTTTLPILLGLTVLVIYIVLAVLYEHVGHPLTILTALPLAGLGALLMLFIFHQELNIFSFVGIILLVGLVKKNGIMMVDFALDLQREQRLDPTEAIIRASLTRFRPIMMTTLAAILATLPIALGLGAGAESRRPLGIAVVGGLLFSQLLTLFITPAFYVSLDRGSEWLRARLGRRVVAPPAPR